MKTTIDFLDEAKAKRGFTSDYQLAKHLECTRGSISSYRTGRTHLDEEMACKIAEELGLDSSYVLACIASERAKKPEVKKAWAHAAELLYGLAAVFALVAFLPFAPDIMTAHPGTLEGAPLLAFAGFTNEAGIYIMRISIVEAI